MVKTVPRYLGTGSSGRQRQVRWVMRGVNIGGGDLGDRSWMWLSVFAFGGDGGLLGSAFVLRLANCLW